MLITTPLGTAVATSDNAPQVRPPWYTASIPGRLAAAGGFLYCVLSLWALQSQGAVSFFGPLIGITAAMVVFIHRTVQLWGGRWYLARLRRYERTGRLVLVPPGLLQQAAEVCEAHGHMQPHPVLAGDFKQANTLIELYKTTEHSAKVERILQSPWVKTKKSPKPNQK